MNNISLPMRSNVRLVAGFLLALAGAGPVPAHACSAQTLIGDICMTVTIFCPPGFLPADGRLLKISEHTDLFSLIGTVYGGTVPDTFALPDLRGRVIVGAGQAQDAGFAPVEAGQRLGQPGVTLSTRQLPVPAHTHDAVFAMTGAKRDVNVAAVGGGLKVGMALPVSRTTAGATAAPRPGDAYLAAVGVSGGSATGLYTPVAPPAAPRGTLPARVTVSGAAARTASMVNVDTVTGGTIDVGYTEGKAASAPVATQGPALAMLMCIAVKGQFPSDPTRVNQSLDKE
ncbi:phage tail protein [uncultured Massilia sp.]|uniref:phage tail protein n=1 Tax=uncultured Massilia sp. TaxID=169973 RepID=UPI0025FF8037|nr:tail fiber protein [uncultured Massilia sp.]